MSYLALDISSTCTGYSRFSKDGKLIEKGRISPDKDIDVMFRLHYIVSKVKELFHNVDELIIEGIYLGRNPTAFEKLAKIAGAVIYSWIEQKYQLPIVYNASQARKLVGVKGTSQKAEIQLWVLSQYDFAPKEQIEEWSTIMDSLKAEFKAKEITRNQFKYRANKLSDIIDAETNIGEDVADSILLGRAYKEASK